ncbi:MAG: hypothetical protein IJM56_06665 [Clostridia bacterium]|nr:hypothetical protein [Clostridia bacterium]
MDLNILSEALHCLAAVTPLKTDCGEYCGAACCKDNGEAGSGVWLLPGEDDESPIAWAKLYLSKMPVCGEEVHTVYCLKPCQREARPFLCRIFPLSPYYSNKKQCWSVRMDRRAAAICPLYSWGKNGLSSEFVSAAERAVQLLSQDEDYLEVLKKLEAEEAAYRFEL